MNAPHQTGDITASLLPSRSTRTHTRGAIVGWALLVWFVADLPTDLIALLSKRFVWTEYLIFDSILVAASLLLLRRDSTLPKDAGICLPYRSIKWAPNLVALVGLNTAASMILFAAHAPGTILNSLPLWKHLIVACFTAPIAEELFMRGWFQTAFLQATNMTRPVSAILASATLFAAMHSLVSLSLVRNLLTVIAAFLGGLVLGRVRQQSGSVIPAMFMHSIFNASGWLVAKPIWHLFHQG